MRLPARFGATGGLRPTAAAETAGSRDAGTGAATTAILLQAGRQLIHGIEPPHPGAPRTVLIRRSTTTLKALPRIRLAGTLLLLELEPWESRRPVGPSAAFIAAPTKFGRLTGSQSGKTSAAATSIRRSVRGATATFGYLVGKVFRPLSVSRGRPGGALGPLRLDIASPLREFPVGGIGHSGAVLRVRPVPEDICRNFGRSAERSAPVVAFIANSIAFLAARTTLRIFRRPAGGRGASGRSFRFLSGFLSALRPESAALSAVARRLRELRQLETFARLSLVALGGLLATLPFTASRL